MLPEITKFAQGTFKSHLSQNEYFIHSHVMLLRPVCLHRLELPELHHRRDEEPSEGPAEGHRHLMHPLPDHLRVDHCGLPHVHERIRSARVSETAVTAICQNKAACGKQIFTIVMSGCRVLATCFGLSTICRWLIVVFKIVI